MDSILIENIRIVDNPESNLEPSKAGYICLENGLISNISMEANHAPKSLKQSVKVNIDGEGGVVLPGIHNAHVHTEQVLMEGIGDGLNLSEWLSGGIRHLTNSMTGDDMFFATLCAFARYVSEGVTSIAIHQKNCVNSALCDAVIAAAKTLGIRIFLFRGWRDQGTSGEQAECAIKDIERIRKVYENNVDVKVGLAIPSHWNCSPPGLRTISDAVNNLKIPIQIHVSETADELKQCRNDYEMTPIFKMDKFNLITNNTELIHCTCLTEEDIDLIAMRDASVIHCPGSNFSLRCGIAPVRQLINKGVNVSLGTDGAAGWRSSSMLMEAVYASIASRMLAQEKNPVLVTEATQLAWTTRARHIWSPNGKMNLFVGSPGDVTLFKKMESAFRHTIGGKVFSAASFPQVKTVICQGKLVMNDGLFTGLDINDLADNLTSVRKKLMKELERE